MEPVEGELPRDIASEIRQVAHFGHAGAVRDDMLAAAAGVEVGRPGDPKSRRQRAKEQSPRTP